MVLFFLKLFNNYTIVITTLKAYLLDYQKENSDTKTGRTVRLL